MHYAEQREQFEPAALDNLRTHYSDAQVAEILAYVRTITLGGLTGNTLEALLGHVRSWGRGRTAESTGSAPPPPKSGERS